MSEWETAAAVGGSAGDPQPVPAEPDTGPGERAERLARLLVRAQAGDREALHAIVAELTPLLWNVARGQGLYHADAEDVVQSVWLSLVARLAHIDTPTALVGWLVTACRRESWRSRSARDRARALEPERVAELAERDGAAEPAEHAEERVLADERLRVVRTALDRLSPRCAELLRMLALVERPDYTVVAQSLGMPRGSVGPTRGRCLAKLRALLQADAGWSAVCP